MIVCGCSVAKSWSNAEIVKLVLVRELYRFTVPGAWATIGSVESATEVRAMDDRVQAHEEYAVFSCVLNHMAQMAIFQN
jgi:hypothetical protein